ncbi:MAG: ATP-binding cassette domain-containing protein [Clostridia bacterium]|nr:ATP-binding cassette domain-containing protein [Clostridia bacterium]
MDYVLTSHSLCKSYKKFHALSDFSIHIPKGSVYGLIGRNGAGKTTFIRLVCGLQEPTGGVFNLYGEDSGTKGIYSARRRIGAIIESPAIYRNMTAKENLRQQYRALGLPSFDGIDELLELVGLSGTGKKKAGHFSLGMRQRLGIAVALCGNPDFLILDEPMNGLDPQGIIEIRELILKLNREMQVTILISSHILDELSRVATHYGFMDKGTMIKEMSEEELNAVQKKCVRLTVDNITALSVFLEKQNIEYSIVSDTQADVYGEINIAQLITGLFQSGCNVTSMHEKNESLESYFINLVGGEENV